MTLTTTTMMMMTWILSGNKYYASEDIDSRCKRRNPDQFSLLGYFTEVYGLQHPPFLFYEDLLPLLMRPSFIDESFSLPSRNDFPTSNSFFRIFLLDSLYRLCRGHRINNIPLTRGTLAAMYCKVEAPSSPFGPIR